jgi:hypothetical protein
VRRDPTQTLDLRTAFQRVLDKRWNALAKLTTQAVYKEDRWGLTKTTPNTIGIKEANGDHVTAFQAWFDTALNEIILGDAREFWIGSYISRAFERGWKRSQLIVNKEFPVGYDRASVIVALTVTELQGAMEVVSQQAVRAFSNGIINRTQPRKIAAEIDDRIRKIGRTRSRATAANMIVRAHAEASLDVFELAQVAQVGIVPESLKIVRVKDAKELPSGRTIRRRKLGERKLQRLRLVEVVTAGDDDVCQECQDIAEEGPYTISMARGLIPAHPDCRCAFVPFFDERFAEDEWNEGDHPRDPDGKFGEGGGEEKKEEPKRVENPHREFRQVSKGTDKELNHQIVEESGIKLSYPEGMKDDAEEAVAHVVADIGTKDAETYLRGTSIEVKELKGLHGLHKGKKLYVSAQSLREDGPGFGASVIRHELEHRKLSAMNVPTGQQENRVRQTAGSWAAMRYSSMATTNPRAAKGFLKAAREQGIKIK